MSLEIFNIQKFSIHDGPGIRTTVFLKGCPLRCLWCQNPESFEKGRQLIVDDSKCIGCNECIEFCKNDECMLCGECVEVCLQNARSIIGKELSDDEIIREIMKDEVFYEESGGGVTFSGGEALMQTEQLLPILKRLKADGIHIAMDTSGYATLEQMSEIIDYVDLYLYDLKLIDSDKHKKFTGVNNEKIIENLQYLSDMNKKIWIRIPLIDEINTSVMDIGKFIEVLNKIKIEQVNLIPYHSLATGKYQKIGMDYLGEHLKEPSVEVIKRIRMELEYCGYKVIVGG